jgi:hypothetical protein
MQESKVTARLPRLDVEIVRQRTADEESETLYIRLQARPTLQAWSRSLLQDTAPPALMLWTNPLLAWTHMLASMWQPWLTPSAFGGLDTGNVEVLPPEPAVRPAATADAMHRTTRATHS